MSVLQIIQQWHWFDWVLDVVVTNQSTWRNVHKTWIFSNTAVRISNLLFQQGHAFCVMDGTHYICSVPS